jgi:hypothetical protein
MYRKRDLRDFPDIASVEREFSFNFRLPDPAYFLS